MQDILTFCRPEDVGVHPSWVEDYVQRINKGRTMQHSFLMMRGTKVFAEGYYRPFHEKWLHRMYSISKSFVSAAIGMLCDEEKISLDDRIAPYFPEQDDGNVHPLIGEVTIRDLLMMATCHVENTYDLGDLDWVYTFFHPRKEPDHQPGTQFRYETSATHMLGVLVQRVTGKTFLEYLKDKALRELGFSEDAWCVESPEGYAWGGSGVECTTRDLARFALLFAHGGLVGNKRYLSADFVRDATSPLIDNSSFAEADAVVGHGYGYQIWSLRDGAFGFNGMGGQLGVIIPQKDLVFICTNDLQTENDTCYHSLVDLFFETIVDRMTESALPCDDAANERLRSILGALELNVPEGAVFSPLQGSICGAYDLEENPMQIRSFAIEFHGGHGLLTYDTARGIKRFPFCLGRYADTILPESNYFGRRMMYPKGSGYRCLNTAVWEKKNVLALHTYVIDDYFGNMTAKFTFDEDRVSLQMERYAEWFLDEYNGCANGMRRRQEECR